MVYSTIMAQQKKQIEDYDFAVGETILHGSAITCNGCNRKFCTTIQDKTGTQRLCRQCFFHREGIDATLEILEQLHEFHKYVWEIPYADIPEEIRYRIDQYLIHTGSKN